MNPSSDDLPDVAALLKELESSAAWQELRAANAALAPVAGPSLSRVLQSGTSITEPQFATNDIAISGPSTTDPSAALPSIAGTSVADLLSQLSSSARFEDPVPSTSSNFSYGSSQSVLDIPPPSVALSRSVPSGLMIHHDEHRENRQKFTFVQSLPVLSALGEDPGFVATIKKMKDDQNQLERRLWADREAIYAKYEDKMKVAQTKAQMIGTPVSQHEINMITDAFKKELFRFDHERVLPAWDGLASRQQSELGQMSVPTMFVTTDVQDRKTQQQVISVLETIAGPNVI